MTLSTPPLPGFGWMVANLDIDLVDLLRPYDAEKMKAWRVSGDVGNARNNWPDLLDPVG
jgi:putative SOS response-associated peptidase YedK